MLAHTPSLYAPVSIYMFYDYGSSRELTNILNCSLLVVFTVISRCERDTTTQRLFNVGPPSVWLAQHQGTTGLMSRVRWDRSSLRSWAATTTIGSVVNIANKNIERICSCGNELKLSPYSQGSLWKREATDEKYYSRQSPENLILTVPRAVTKII